MNLIRLNAGNEIPQLGFGLYDVPNSQTEEVVLNAIETGYRHFDTAQYYGNEIQLGRAIKASGIGREEFFITTKVNTSGYAATKNQIKIALDNLQTDYIDLMLIHWVVSDYIGTYEALVEAFEEGKIKSIGLSNFKPSEIDKVIEHFNHVPAVLQNEMNVFQQQNETRQYCDSKGIVFESWAPFGEGKENMFGNPILTAIGEKYNQSAAQVILAFLLNEGVVCIPKAATLSHMRDNFAAQSLKLSQDDINTIKKMNRGRGLFGWND